VTSVNLVTKNSPRQLMAAIAKTPVSVAVAAEQDFQFYESGILDSTTCGTNLDHAILAVGFNQTNQTQGYYIVRNSWGKFWGEEGYIRIAITDGEGICGI